MGPGEQILIETVLKAHHRHHMRGHDRPQYLTRYRVHAHHVHRPLQVPLVLQMTDHAVRVVAGMVLLGHAPRVRPVLFFGKLDYY